MSSLRDVASGFASRRAEILAERELEVEVGFPVRRRPDANRYAVPVSRKQIRVPVAATRSTPFEPEPALADKDYEAVLAVLSSSRT